MMPPDCPTFIDAHEKDGCKAASYDFVSIDLVGPEEFAITRGSLRPATKSAPPQLVGESVWAIDATAELPNVVRLTITPLTGPDRVAQHADQDLAGGGRGCTSLLTIPEWDAVYIAAAPSASWARIDRRQVGLTPAPGRRKLDPAPPRRYQGPRPG